MSLCGRPVLKARLHIGHHDFSKLLLIIAFKVCRLSLKELDYACITRVSYMQEVQCHELIKLTYIEHPPSGDEQPYSYTYSLLLPCMVASSVSLIFHSLTSGSLYIRVTVTLRYNNNNYYYSPSTFQKRCTDNVIIIIRVRLTDN